MKRLIYPALLGLALAGCSQAEPEAQMVAAEAASPDSNLPLPAAAADTTFNNAAGPTAQPHKLVYQGELSLVVADFNQATTRLNHLLEQHEAYLRTAHETRADGQHRQEMTVQVPPAQFVALVTALGQLGRVENKDVTSADIAAEVLQTTQRLAARQATAATYQQRLARATKDEASQLRAQTRQLQLAAAADQARLQQFGARSRWATLRLRYYQPLAATDATELQPAFAPQFEAAFSRGWSVVLRIAVGLTTVWPLLVLGGVGAWGWRWWRLRHPEPA